MTGSVEAAPPGEVWTAVAAPGTDPVRLGHVVALRTSAAGRAALRAGRADDATTSGQQRRDAVVAAVTWRGLGVRVCLPGDPAWPTRLDRLTEPPWFLAARGRLPDPDSAAVAVVGARRASPYGTAVAAWLAEAAASAGAVVVSGGARGVDAAAHGAAVEHGTVVVLGCGHDVPYPSVHAGEDRLFGRVVAGGGGLLSELLPTTSPHPGAVRSRNRIVAALVDVVVVVEGGGRSGSLVTAGVAADLGVDVLAVPGDVRAAGSAAPHRLLREGAGVCAAPDDLLAALGTTHDPGAAASSSGGSGSVSVLPEPLRAALAASWPRPLRTDQLVRSTGHPVGLVLAAVTRGVVAGELADGPEGVRLRRAPA